MLVGSLGDHLLQPLVQSSHSRWSGRQIHSHDAQVLSSMCFVDRGHVFPIGSLMINLEGWDAICWKVIIRAGIFCSDLWAFCPQNYETAVLSTSFSLFLLYMMIHSQGYGTHYACVAVLQTAFRFKTCIGFNDHFFRVGDTHEGLISPLKDKPKLITYSTIRHILISELLRQKNNVPEHLIKLDTAVATCILSWSWTNSRNVPKYIRARRDVCSLVN